MKTKLFALVLMSLPFFGFAQQWNGSSNTTSNIYRSGDVSVYINSSNQTTLGAAWGGANIGYGTGYIGFNLSRNNHSNGLWAYTSDGANNGANVIYGDILGNLNFSNRSSNGNFSGSMFDANVVDNIRMRIMNDGKVMIGNPATLPIPGTYKLYVENGILTEKVKVAIKTTSDWADYVFKKNYYLTPLPTLSAYVNKYHHLPGIPSADEVLKNGVDLGDMTSKLLGKIEELTLYIIQLDKKNEELTIQVKELEKDKTARTLLDIQKQMDTLKKQLEGLRK